MINEYFVKYKQEYLQAFIKECKKENGLPIRELKRILYADSHLTDDEKDIIWETIIRFGYIERKEDEPIY